MFTAPTTSVEASGCASPVGSSYYAESKNMNQTKISAICPTCKRDVSLTAGGKFCTHNQSGSFEVCDNSRKVALCSKPGMVSGEHCVLAFGHDGAHLPRPGGKS